MSFFSTFVCCFRTVSAFVLRDSVGFSPGCGEAFFTQMSSAFQIGLGTVTSWSSFKCLLAK